MQESTAASAASPSRSLIVAAAALATALMVAGCGPGADREAAIAAAEQEAVSRVEVRIDSIDSLLAEQPGLIAETRRALRKYLNKQQVATAREFGVDPVSDSAAVRRLAEQGALVRLEDSTEYWVVRKLDHSVPYVTPDTREMLTELGRGFHEALDSLGLPPFRFEISSVLRTAAMQADLRSGNPNASRTTSSHEFGTTVDVAYNNFSEPADLEPFIVPPPDTLSLDASERERLVQRTERHAAARLSELGEERAAELKGILGAVLRDMQEDNKVQPLIERAQPVYHMTVARHYPAPDDPTSVD